MPKHCGKHFRTPEGEEQDHACPSCGTEPIEEHRCVDHVHFDLNECLDEHQMGELKSKRLFNSNCEKCCKNYDVIVTIELESF